MDVGVLEGGLAGEAGDTFAVVGASEVPEDVARVFHEHYGALAGWCAGLTGSHQIGEEIADEAFIRLLSRWRAVREPRAYLYTVAGNLTRDHWRQERREQRALKLFAEQPASRDTFAAREIRDVVERLPSRLRSPVLLHFYADLSIAQIAASLHRPQGTIKRQLAEARALLERDLKETR